jgi:hypothetical protein
MTIITTTIPGKLSVNCRIPRFADLPIPGILIRDLRRNATNGMDREAKMNLQRIRKVTRFTAEALRSPSKRFTRPLILVKVNYLRGAIIV